MLQNHTFNLWLLTVLIEHMHLFTCETGTIKPTMSVCVFVCSPHQQQQQNHVCMVARTCDMQSRPLVFVLQVYVQTSLHQKLCCKHIVVASTLQRAERVEDIFSRYYYPWN